LPGESCRQGRFDTGSDGNSRRSSSGVISNEICRMSRLDVEILRFHESYERHNQNVCQIHYELESLRMCVGKKGRLWEQVEQ